MPVARFRLRLRLRTGHAEAGHSGRRSPTASGRYIVRFIFRHHREQAKIPRFGRSSAPHNARTSCQPIPVAPTIPWTCPSSANLFSEFLRSELHVPSSANTSPMWSRHSCLFIHDVRQECLPHIIRSSPRLCGSVSPLLLSAPRSLARIIQSWMPAGGELRKGLTKKTGYSSDSEQQGRADLRRPARPSDGSNQIPRWLSAIISSGVRTMRGV